MRRSLDTSVDRGNDLADLDALVLAEIASLGRGRIPQTANTCEAKGSDITSDRGRPESGRGWPSPQVPQPAAPIRAVRRDDSLARGLSGEEAEGLFDQPFDLAEEDEGGPAEGPTAADLLTPEEQAFIARAVGFLSGRPSADLILDRVWSQAIQSRPDGFYDPETPDPYPGADPEPSVGEGPGKSSAVGRPIPGRAAEPTAGSPTVIPCRPAPAPPSDPSSPTQGPPE